MTKHEKRTFGVLLLAASVTVGLTYPAWAGFGGVAADRGETAGRCGSGTTLSNYVDASGCITLPRDLSVGWAHLGSWMVPGENGGVHDVYTQRTTVEAFRRDRRFPDGSILVKSVRNVANANLTTGNAHWATDQNIWFVMVKDSQNRFAGANPLWGDGWGWALFEAANPDSNVATDYRRDCMGCHTPRRESDWIYLEGYPTLR